MITAEEARGLRENCLDGQIRRMAELGATSTEWAASALTTVEVKSLRERGFKVTKNFDGFRDIYTISWEEPKSC